MNAKITSISVEPGQAGQRFVIGLRAGENNEYFSTPLNPSTEKAQTSSRINLGQLRNAIPALMGSADPIREMLVKRSKFIGVEVELVVEDQLDSEGNVVMGKNGKPYHNVRLLPSNSDLSEEQVNALLANTATVSQDLES